MLGRTLFALQTCYHWGRTEIGHWEDAEQFLAYVDDAYVGEDKIKLENLDEVIRRGWRPVDGRGQHALQGEIAGFLSQHLHLAARRALAAQCSRFLFNRHPQSEETWLPFREWARRLEPSVDAIITFNYDRVLEMLDPQETRFHVLMPHEASDTARIPVFKLHGSVDWVVVDGGAQLKKVPDSLKSTSTQIAIAPPGRSKSHFVAEHFEDLWKRAEGLLSHVDLLVLVGYGFPKTDSIAESRILDALRSDECPESIRDIHVILGPEVTTSSSQRVLALLQICAGTRRKLIMVPPLEPMGPAIAKGYAPGVPRFFRIKQHPLWSQDFLGHWLDHVHQASSKGR